MCWRVQIRQRHFRQRGYALLSQQPASGANEKWRPDENAPGVKRDEQFSTCVVLGKSVRQPEWQVRPAGHPRTGLNPMIGSTGARPDKQFHLRHITDTEWKFGCYCAVTDFFPKCCYACVKAGSCCLHGDNVMVPELQRNGNAFI